MNLTPTPGTDHFKLIQALLDAAAANGGGRVRLRPGVFPIGNTLRPASNVALCCEGLGITRIVPHEYFAGPLIAVGMPLQSLDPAYRPAVPPGTYDVPTPPRWAVATKGDTVAAGVGLPLQFGRMPQGGGPDLWGGPEPLTIDFFVDARALPENTPIFGLGDCDGNPAPWLVCRVAEGFALDYATEGTTGRHRVVIPDAGDGARRLSVQLDFDRGAVSAWVCGRSVKARIEPDWPAKGLGAKTGARLKAPDGFAPFLLGSAFNSAGLGTNQMADVTFYGLRVSRGLLYDPTQDRQTLLLDPGTPVTDEIRFFSTHPKVLPSDSLVGLLPLTDAPTGRPEVAVDSPGCRCYLEFCPPQGDTKCENVAIQNVTLEGRMQPSILTGQVFKLFLDRVEGAGSGSQGYGTLPLQVSYPVTLDRCVFSGADAAVVSHRQVLTARNLDLIAGRHALRVLGGHGGWDDCRVWRLAPWTEAVCRLVGHDDGAEWGFTRLLVDNEEPGKAVTSAIVEAEQGPGQAGRLEVNGLSVAQAASSGVLLRLIGHGVDNGPYKNPYGVEARGLKSAGAVPNVVEVVGPPTWTGTVDGSLLPPGSGVSAPAAKAAGRVVVTPPVDFKGKGT